MPQYIVQQIAQHEKSIEEISGQHEVTNAQVPAGVKAASAINLLQEADDTRLGPRVYEMEDNLGYAGEMLLKLVGKYWTEERTIQIAGADNAWDIMTFRGDSLKENTRVEVQAGSGFPRSKAAKQAAIESILQLVFQYEGQQPVNPRQLSKVLGDLEQGALQKLFGDLSATEGQISRENGEIMQGGELPINPYDQHEMHIEGHEEEQRTTAYEMASPLVKQSMERHVFLHRQQIMQQMQMQQQMQQQQQEEQAQQQMAHQAQSQIQTQALAPPEQPGAQNGSKQAASNQAGRS